MSDDNDMYNFDSSDEEDNYEDDDFQEESLGENDFQEESLGENDLGINEEEKEEVQKDSATNNNEIADATVIEPFYLKPPSITKPKQ